MSNKIEDTLNNLTPEETAVLKTLLTKMASGVETTSETPVKEQKTRRQRRRPQANKKQTNRNNNRRTNARRNNSKQKVDIYDVDDDDDEDEQITQKINRRRGQRGGQTKGKKTKLCVTERIQLDGNNQFLKMREHKIKSGDLSPGDDKLLIGKNRPTERGPTRLLKVRCSGCGRKKLVAPHLVYTDDDGDIMYTCDSCIDGKRNQ